jgi:hypothetical protein
MDTFSGRLQDRHDVGLAGPHQTGLHGRDERAASHLLIFINVSG